MHYAPGTALRFRGLGSGYVVSEREREFQGSARVFIRVEFPHRSMVAEVPLGDPKTEGRMFPVISKTAAGRLMRSLKQPGKTLLRTWEERERDGKRRITEGGPEEWAQLLRDYARAESEGLDISVSDIELIREARELLAAEISCACQSEFAVVLAKVEQHYSELAQPPVTAVEQADQPQSEAAVALAS